MEEQKLNNENRVLFGALICIVISVLFSRLAIGSLLFTLPLLLFVPGIRKTRDAVLTFAASAVLIVAVTLFDFRNSLSRENLGLILFALYFQLVSLVGAMVWTGLREYSDSVLRKLVICSFPIAIIGLSFSVFICLNDSSAWIEGIRNYLNLIIDTGIVGIDAGSFANIFIAVLAVISVPMGMVFSAIPVILSEFILKKHNVEWQKDFANMKMPNYYIWVFMASWAVVVISSFVRIPFWMTIIGWNFALGLTLHYFINGISIVTSVLRRKQSEELSAGRICMPVFVVCILPVVNIIVISGLALLGALETWFKFR